MTKLPHLGGKRLLERKSGMIGANHDNHGITFD
jgi:hypothetical protein